MRSLGTTHTWESLRTAFRAGLFEYGVGRVSRLDLAIEGDVPPGFRAVPDFMIALSGADEVAARRTQKPLQLGREV